MISEEGINKFIELYKKKYGVELSRQEASDTLSELIGLAKFVFID